MTLGVQRTKLQFGCSKWIVLVAQNKVPKLVPFRLIWGNDALRSIEKDKFTNSGILKYVEFWKLGMSINDIYIQKMGIHVRY
jgi:hypothetical protein